MRGIGASGGSGRKHGGRLSSRNSFRGYGVFPLHCMVLISVHARGESERIPKDHLKLQDQSAEARSKKFEMNSEGS